MSAGYSETIRLWATDDRRAGALADADGTGEVGLGDGEAGRKLAVRFTLRLSGDRAETVRYQVFGCGFTIAACAAAAELAEGHSLKEIASIQPAWVDALLNGLPSERSYCADLAVEALQACIQSASVSHRPVTKAVVTPESEHAPLVTAQDPTYRLLIDSPSPRGAPAEDRHLFACLLAAAAADSGGMATTGLGQAELADLLDLYFPGVPGELFLEAHAQDIMASQAELLPVLLPYLPHSDEDWTPVPSVWLARALAARSARPGHLWRAMGLFARPELTAAIRRHLPALAEANDRGMRWKRFLFKQLCERAGGILCKTPECGNCSDYALCFDDSA